MNAVVQRIGEQINFNNAFTLFAVFGFTLLYLIYKKKATEKERIKFEEEQLLEKHLKNFKPDNLVDEVHTTIFDKTYTISHYSGRHVYIENRSRMNLSTEDFYSLSKSEGVINEAKKAIRKYGVGSCGPRGFYGTVDIHLDLEKLIATFMGMEEAVVYSYWFSTIASAIPAYCKKDDVIFCDEMISFAGRTGLESIRCKIIYFAHNDAEDLEQKILEHLSSLKKLKRRMFMLIEGIYHNTGVICDLPKFVKIRAKYQMRLFIDESYSIGILGETGKGVLEYYNIDKKEVDLTIGSLEGFAGSVGGFCVGSHYVIEHQRLSGRGYCFSASLPPCLSVAALFVFRSILHNSQDFVPQLAALSTHLHNKLLEIPYIKILSDSVSPIKYFVLLGENGCIINDPISYKSFSRFLLSTGFFINVIKNVGNNQWQIKLIANVSHELEDYDLLVHNINIYIKISRTKPLMDS